MHIVGPPRMVGSPRPGDTGLFCHGTAPAAHFLCSTAHMWQDIRAAWFCSCGLLWRSDECVSHPCFYAQPDIYAVMNRYVVALFFSSDIVTRSADRSGVSNSNCAVGHMRTYKTTRGPHYEADATTPVRKLTRNSFYILFPAKGTLNIGRIGRSFLAVSSFNSSCLRNLINR